MTLKTLCNKILLPQPAIESVIGYHLTEEQYEKYKKIFSTNKEVFFEQVLDKKDYHILFLYLYLRFACDAYEEYSIRGISDDIYFDTFSDITVWCENCFRDIGEYGIKEYNWLWNHLKLRLFRLGRLQFEPIVFDRTLTVNGKVVAKDDLVLNVHIPQGEPLNYEACCNSLKWAERFFRGVPPIFVCHSWLLYPGLKEILKPDSNIIQFQNMFTVYETDDNDRQAEERIFINLSDNPNTYPENTGLQRNAKAYLISGKKLGVGLGIIV